MKTKTPLYDLPAGVRILLISMDPFDARYSEREKYEGKVYTSKKNPAYFSTSFVMEETGKEYVHAGNPKYKILKP